MHFCAHKGQLLLHCWQIAFFLLRDCQTVRDAGLAHLMQVFKLQIVHLLEVFAEVGHVAQLLLLLVQNFINVLVDLRVFLLGETSGPQLSFLLDQMKFFPSQIWFGLLR